VSEDESYFQLNVSTLCPVLLFRQEGRGHFIVFYLLLLGIYFTWVIYIILQQLSCKFAIISSAFFVPNFFVTNTNQVQLLWNALGLLNKASIL
jgi:hypothetical protein